MSNKIESALQRLEVLAKINTVNTKVSDIFGESIEENNLTTRELLDQVQGSTKPALRADPIDIKNERQPFGDL